MVAAGQVLRIPLGGADYERRHRELVKRVEAVEWELLGTPAAAPVIGEAALDAVHGRAFPDDLTLPAEDLNGLAYGLGHWVDQPRATLSAPG